MPVRSSPCSSAGYCGIEQTGEAELLWVETSRESQSLVHSGRPAGGQKQYSEVFSGQKCCRNGRKDPWTENPQWRGQMAPSVGVGMVSLSSRVRFWEGQDERGSEREG